MKPMAIHTGVHQHDAAVGQIDDALQVLFTSSFHAVQLLERVQHVVDAAASSPISIMAAARDAQVVVSIQGDAVDLIGADR